MSGRIARAARNLFGARGALARYFPPSTMGAIRAAIETGERSHAGEIVFAVEPRLGVFEVLAGVDSRTRAAEAFAALGVWDTAGHSGVLVYVLLAERRIEVVADRGIHVRVGEGEWQRVCTLVADGFRSGDPSRGVLAAIAAVNALLAAHFPVDSENPRELPDNPVLL
jgi:hypothetical protein